MDAPANNCDCVACRTIRKRAETERLAQLEIENRQLRERIAALDHLDRRDPAPEATAATATATAPKPKPAARRRRTRKAGTGTAA